MNQKEVRARIKLLHNKVKEVLREWDPIGVEPNKYPECFDEYDSYAGQVVHFIDQDASIEEILDWLKMIEIDHMGLGDYEGEDQRARRLLIGLKEWWSVRKQ